MSSILNIAVLVSVHNCCIMKSNFLEIESTLSRVLLSCASIVSRWSSIRAIRCSAWCWRCFARYSCSDVLRPAALGDVFLNTRFSISCSGDVANLRSGETDMYGHFDTLFIGYPVSGTNSSASSDTPTGISEGATGNCMALHMFSYSSSSSLSSTVTEPSGSCNT